MVESRTGCINGANVTLVTLNHTGHVPFKGVNFNLSMSNPNEIPTTIDTTALAWKFLSQIGNGVTPSATRAPAVPTPSPMTPTTAANAPNSNGVPSPTTTTTSSGTVGRNVGALALVLMVGLSWL
jgi:hypothetical protein